MTKELIEAAKEYFHLTDEELMKKIAFTTDKVIEEWEKRTSNEKYYIDSKWRVFGQIGFNNNERIDILLHPIKDLKGLKILDYGAGVGESAMQMAEKNDVYHYDLPGYTTDFAKFVSKHTNRPLTFLEKKEDVFKIHYDGIILTDTLEHLENPLEIFLRLTLLLKPGGFMLTTGLDFSIGKNIPMHLPENIYFKKYLMMIIDEWYTIRFFHNTKNETIYLLMKKERKNEKV